jgi:hypothetical protein
MMITKRISTFPTLLGLVFIAAAAQAATLFTPPLVPLGTNQLDCYLVNISDQIRTATIDVLNRSGEVLNSVPVTLNPGEEKVATVLASEEPRYCKFVVDGSRIHFRGTVLVRQEGVGSISALPAH